MYLILNLSCLTAISNEHVVMLVYINDRFGFTTICMCRSCEFFLTLCGQYFVAIIEWMMFKSESVHLSKMIVQYMVTLVHICFRGRVVRSPKTCFLIFCGQLDCIHFTHNLCKLIHFEIVLSIFLITIFPLICLHLIPF